MLKIGKITIGMCGTNCYFLYKENCKKVIFVDPADQGDFIYKKLKEAGFEIVAIFLTHGHFDHIWGANELRELTKAPIYAFEGEKELCENAQINYSAYAGRPYTLTADFYVKDGEEIEIEGMKCKVISTPGHTQGSCCYYFEDDQILLSGDTLFHESVGRTDLPTGSHSTLIRSIKEKLMKLPEEVKVYPGHMDETTIGYEKRNNSFL